jgi:YidC/Oxa1 family membrane protein insertase
MYSIHQVSKKTLEQQSGQDNPMMQSMLMMNKIMPLFSFFITLSMPIGIGIYWILGSVIQIIQTFFFDMHFSKIDVDELVRQNIEKASKKKNSGKKSYMQRMLDAQAELEQQREMSLKDYAHINSKNYSEKNNNDDIDNGSQNNYKTGSISSYANIMKSEKGK